MAMAHGGGAVWPHFANMTLGLWLITSAFALGLRSPALQVSDVASGALVILLAALSLSRRPFWKLWAPWANSLVGLWLLFAPSSSGRPRPPPTPTTRSSARWSSCSPSWRRGCRWHRG